MINIYKTTPILIQRHLFRSDVVVVVGLCSVLFQLEKTAKRTICVQKKYSYHLCLTIRYMLSILYCIQRLLLCMQRFIEFSQEDSTKDYSMVLFKKAKVTVEIVCVTF